MSDAYLVPQEDTAAAAIEEIEAELGLFDDWMERYQYIIEMGRKLPPFPEEWQDDAHRVPGCQSQVWLEAVERDGKLFFAGASDAAIVQGLVALLLRVYSGRTNAEILGTSPVFLHDMGLVKALSTNRGSGVEAMAQAIQKRAALPV
ncbi:MAG: SufE family protein [Gluconobacter albidus]